MKTVDARGLSCPQPVVLTKKALESEESEYIVLVDENVAKENVTRFAENKGYKVTVELMEDDEYKLYISKQ